MTQSALTELIFDEAYYWYYSQHMAWGYFDHPPMVALLIKLGGLLFPGELGVRFFSCLLGVGTILVLWLLVDNDGKRDHIPLFFLMLFSMVLLNAYGFLTLPDTPLLFFTVVFLWVYKRFLKENTWPNILFLGVAMACLMYSKYHAVLVIFFVLLSNLSLVRNSRAWAAVGVALLCYVPHLIWLYQNDFVPINYHLFERPNQPYNFEGFTLGYVTNLIVNFGLLFPWFFWALFKAKADSKFKRALIFLSYGIMLFFFISSFQRRTQAQWVIVMCIPMALLTYGHLLSHAKNRKWAFRISILSGILLLYARAWLVHAPLFPVFYETHGNKDWVNEVVKNVGDTPVVFENSYRRAPMYAFYSGNTSYSLNNAHYRKNQYSIDNSEAQVQNQRVAYITQYATSGDFHYHMPDSTKFYGWYIDDFESYRKIKCLVERGSDASVGNILKVKVVNPYDKQIPLSKLDFAVNYLNTHKQFIENVPITLVPEKKGLKTLDSKGVTYFTYTMPEPRKEKPSYFRVVISENGLRHGLNGENVKIH
ncbi:MAG: ArnT family glycosyltransferase [Flavobacteriaceae bacterium]